MVDVAKINAKWAKIKEAQRVGTEHKAVESKPVKADRGVGYRQAEANPKPSNKKSRSGNTGKRKTKDN
jgi:hypothetical protein